MKILSSQNFRIAIISTISAENAEHLRWKHWKKETLRIDIMKDNMIEEKMTLNLLYTFPNRFSVFKERDKQKLSQLSNS